MIDGLKLAMTGEQIIATVSARIEDHRATIRQKRDDGEAGRRPADDDCPMCAVSLDDDIAQLEHSIQVLMVIRGHIVPAETYLLGRNDLEFAELLPEPPPVEHHWVSNIPNAAPVTSSSGD